MKSAADAWQLQLLLLVAGEGRGATKRHRTSWQRSANGTS